MCHMCDSDRERFLRSWDVSRETLERLDIHADLVRRWTRRINLVSGATLKALWSRHFLDSAQLFRLAPASAGCWLDLGSGGGFPGLVIAALAAEDRPDLRTSLVESDSRKATFLRTAAREMGLKVQLHVERVEKLRPQNSDIVSARALAPLNLLLEYAKRHVRDGGLAIFPKGEKVKSEIAIARKTWQFELEQVSSLTDEAASILRITEFSRV